ncbi:biotin--[acetyl-CoA-carboxylase] ligase [Lactococcus nasutitermitis]|uniref:Bifunctional ligase/repressor BirA n=1 Tax=Lactococcus nasutitermitis TaxID=1652957 RepID=A0ABV9JD59_9LACT|nr:biotin--[acetyl-CoA-carboxylase] ligase [Lactococcus nasutitermitis]
MESTKQYVLFELLKGQGEWISGDSLASQLKISRESIWKAINTLKKNGNQIISRKNLGYKYIGNSSLDSDIINFYSHQQFANNIYVFKETSSTQDLAKQFLSKHPVDKPVIFIANQQSQGYGRRGRLFYSPAETGLYFSVILPNPTNDLFQAGLLTTSMSVVISRVLEEFYPEKDFQLKWVNDIYLETRKVAGIITEAVLDLESNSATSFIMGVGINLATKHFPQNLLAKASGISPDKEINRNQLAARMIEEVIKNSQNYTNPELLVEYRRRSNILEKQVTLQLGTQVIKGKAEEIKEDGGLLIRQENGELKKVRSGEVIKVDWDE